MCGLWGGAAYGLSDLELERIAQLGVVSQLRGTDSTGILSCFRQRDKVAFKIMKDVCNSSEFIYSEEYVSHVKEKRPFIIAGHCRDATVGVVNYDNAHPYNLGKIVGMKNGTVPDVPGRGKDETDSRALLRLLQESGVEVAAKAAEKGGCALVWADTRDLTLNFYRNSRRPLWIMEAGGTIYWASEYYMLALVRDRTGIRYDSCKIEAVPLETHRKYRMSVGFSHCVDTKIQTSSYNLGQITKQPKKEEETIVVTPPKTETAVPVTRAPKPRQETKNYAPDVKVEGFKGYKMTVAKAVKISRSGCSNCGIAYEFKDLDKVSMFSKREWLCPKCAGDPFAKMQAGAHNKELYQCKIIVGIPHGHC
jgi:hypothetical protein